jgi:hypothetical protein
MFSLILFFKEKKMNSINKDIDKNKYNLCTLDDKADCASCGISAKLACKWDKGIKNNFLAISFPPILIVISGMVLMGIVLGRWWPLPVYVFYFMSMFSIFEIRFLCSHCPYYPDGGKTLRCMGNHGSPKLWKYHPEPMNRFERFMMSFGVVGMIFFILPVLFLGSGIYSLSVSYAQTGLYPLFGLAALLFAGLLSSISFVSTLKTFYCSKCVNFSCPLNTVSKSIADAYLKRNPVMRKAWEAEGYVITGTGKN